MTKRRKLIIGILLLVLIGLWFFQGRRVTFSFECLSAETELETNFEENRNAFYDLKTFVGESAPIRFNILSDDTLYMTFQDSVITHPNLLIDNNYLIRPETKSEFRFNDNGCLVVVETDTTEVCNHNWEVQFFGHYKDKRIDHLLEYYGWTRKDFEQLVEKVQELDCSGFVKDDHHFGLNYKIISYHNDGILHCFGHSDGFFDYLYTLQPDSFHWQNSLKKLGDNYYGIEHWNF